MQWHGIHNLTTHTISGLCVDDVIVLSQRWYQLFAKAAKQLCFKHDVAPFRNSALVILHIASCNNVS